MLLKNYCWKILAMIAVTATLAAAQPYIITGSGTSFTATRNGVVVGRADAALNTVMESIRTDAQGNPCTIQFGNGVDILDASTMAVISFRNTTTHLWGTVTLSGKLRMGNSSIVLYDSVSVVVQGDMPAFIIYEQTTLTVISGSIGRIQIQGGSVTVLGGTVSAINTVGAMHDGNVIGGGTLTINGGTISESVILGIGATMTVSGGTVSGGVALSAGAIMTVSGGTILSSSLTSPAITTGGIGSGKITISGTARVTNESVHASTIHIRNATTLEIIGGTISNNISGGTAIATINDSLILGGNPTITGIISLSAYLELIPTGTVMKFRTMSVIISGTNRFTPGSRIFTLNVPANVTLREGDGEVIVRNGANFISNFTLLPSPLWNAGLGAYRLTARGSDLILSHTIDQISVLSPDRIIPPVTPDNAAVVAPITISAGEFTAGPNPVSKSSGSISFYWQGKALSGGTLSVFDVNGNFVARISVSDNGANTSRREIGRWNVGNIAEGTYIVRGVLTAKNGTRERVSVVVGVR